MNQATVDPYLIDDAQFLEYLKRLARRAKEALRIYTPRPEAAPFHSSMAYERLVLAGNQAGKTLCCAVEVARAVTNQDPFGKWPQQGLFYCVGLDGDHLGRTMFKKLFLPGAFDVVRDMETRLWRPANYDNPDDVDRHSEWRQAGALIPPRFIKGFTWEKKGESIPRTVKLHNGWEMVFLSSRAIPEQGTQIDGAWFDEEIDGVNWYGEVAARLVKRNGRFIWSATPQASTIQLWDLHKRASDPDDDGVEEFILNTMSNPYLSMGAKKRMAQKLSDDEYGVRILGQFKMQGMLCYPNMGDDHRFDPELWAETNYRPPANWCNYLAIDPGVNPGAVLFASVPPPSEHGKWGDIAVVWDELYVRGCDADLLAENVLAKVDGLQFEAFIIDKHGGRLRDIGGGLKPEEQYEAAFHERGIVSRTTGNGFMAGADKPRARVLAVRKWLRNRHGDGPKLRFIVDAVPKLWWERQRYRFKKDATGVISEEPEPKYNHLCDSLGYLVQHGMDYVAPDVQKKSNKPSKAYLDFQAHKERESRSKRLSKPKFSSRW